MFSVELLFYIYDIKVFLSKKIQEIKLIFINLKINYFINCIEQYTDLSKTYAILSSFIKSKLENIF